MQYRKNMVLILLHSALYFFLASIHFRTLPTLWRVWNISTFAKGNQKEPNSYAVSPNFRKVGHFSLMFAICTSILSFRIRFHSYMQLFTCFCGLIETMECFIKMFMSDPTVFLRLQKPIPLSHWNHRNRSHALIETAETDSMVSLRQQYPYFANNYLEYISDYKAIYETALAAESGP
jgi:hypothetical protein